MPSNLPPLVEEEARMRRVRIAIVFSALCLSFSAPALAQDASFEEAVVDIGNVGLTITNAGFIGRPAVRNNPIGAPSFEYPLNSGVEHLFDAGLWIGVQRANGSVTVRTGAATSSSGYAPGREGYEFTQLTPIFSRSTLPTSSAFTRNAISHQDFYTSFVDTARVLPGTFIPTPDPQNRIGAKVTMESYAWNFPFSEEFVILQFNIVNISAEPWDSVYVGLYHDLVVRNVNTTTDAGSAYFNKGGYGYIDSLQTTYAFNAGGPEETINTYGAISVLGGQWPLPGSGDRRFFHPSVAQRYVDDGLTAPKVNYRWWKFSGGDPGLTRPADDQERYRRMSTPYPNPLSYTSDADYQAALTAWLETLRTSGLRADGNWIGMTSLGPFPTVVPGDTLSVTFAMVASSKPEEFQGQAGKAIDNADTRAPLRNNILWARRTFAGEDNNYNGILDPGEDINGNGVLDRYLIPEPPATPNVKVVLEEGVATLYWSDNAEYSRDPVTGKMDFEGYRVYRTDPGADLSGNITQSVNLIAQFDQPGNRTGFNNGFAAVRLPEPVTFPDDTTQYHYKFVAGDLLSGWQYLFAVTAFDEGDLQAGLEPFESSRLANAVRVFPGTPASGDEKPAVGVYPNPYRVNAAWDGTTSRTRKLNFYNLPARSVVRIYTLAGELVDEFEHDAATYTGDIRWYNNFSAEGRLLPGGEHSWDLLTESGLNMATGLYLFTVKDSESGEVQTGKFAVIK